MDVVVDSDERRRPDVTSDDKLSLILAMQALYQVDVVKADPQAACTDVLSNNWVAPLNKPSETGDGFEQTRLQAIANTAVGHFVTESVLATSQERAIYDEIIIKHITCNWDLERMGSIERCILRIGTYALLNNCGLKSEAIPPLAAEIAQEYCSERCHGLILAILDSIRRDEA